MGMQACLIQWPELVTCPSAQCTEESGWLGVLGQHAHCNFRTGGLGNFPPTGGSCTPDAKKTRQRAQNGRLVPRLPLLASIYSRAHKTHILARINAQPPRRRPSPVYVSLAAPRRVKTLCAECSHASAPPALGWPGVAGCGYAC